MRIRHHGMRNGDLFLMTGMTMSHLKGFATWLPHRDSKRPIKATSWKNACFSLLVVCSLLGWTSAQTVGVDVCACQPSTYQITLNFSATCDDSTLLPQSPGVFDVVCLVDGDSNTTLDDKVPVSVSSVQFLELDEGLDVIRQVADDQGQPYMSGAMLNYTSIVANTSIVFDVTSIPQGLVVLVNGVNAEGQNIVFSAAIDFSNSCGELPELDGMSIGWVTYQADPNSANPALCPLAAGNNTDSIADVIAADPDLAVLYRTIERAGLIGVATTAGPFTLFGPINTAFGAVDQNYLAKLLEPNWILHLRDLLYYHATSGIYPSVNLTDGLILTMVNGENTTVSIVDGNVTLGGAYFNSSQVVVPNMVASNGVVHSVNGLFLPRFIAQDIFDTLNSIVGLDTFVNLIVAAGLEDTVRSTDMTILPPSDAAFDDLPDGIVAYLSDPGNVDDLKTVLLYHMIGIVIPTPAMVNGQLIMTLQGSNVTVSVGEEGTYFFNDAEVLAPDVLAMNGLVDPIDTVLFPPGMMFPSMPPMVTDAPSKMPAESDIPTSSGTGEPTVLPSLFELLEQDSMYSTLEGAVVAAGLDALLTTEGPYTLFGPIDSAFAALPQKDLNKWLEPQYILQLQDLLLYHVTMGDVLSTDLMDGMVLTMANGENITAAVARSGISFSGDYFSDSSVITPDIQASNGYLDSVNGVFLPRFTAQNIYVALKDIEGLSTFYSLLKAANLDKTAKRAELTIFPPTDDAFAALPADVVTYLTDPDNVADLQSVLLYHFVGAVIPSMMLMDNEMLTTIQGSNVTVSIGDQGTVFFNDGEVLVPNILASNGLIDPIDTVLFPPGFVAPSMTPASEAPSAPSMSPASDMPTMGLLPSLFQLVTDDDNLSTLETALVTAGLDTELDSKGPYTLFGPIDDAFAALDQDYLSLLLTPPYELHLQDLLMYHITMGTLMSSDLMDGMVITMTNGENVTVSTANNGVSLSGTYFNASMVVEADILASNGVLHTVDGVFLPRFYDQDLYDTLNGIDGLAIFVTLITQAGLEEMLRTMAMTVFAPTDDAINSLPSDLTTYLVDPANADALRSVLVYHMIGSVSPTNLWSDGMMFTTLEGSNVTVSVGDDGTYFINDAEVLVPDVLARNGLVDPIDTVLFPPTFIGPSMPPAPTPSIEPTTGMTLYDLIVADPDLSTLEGAVVAAGLDSVLQVDGPYTLFGPIDPAFAALDQDYLAKLLTPNFVLHLRNLLTYHLTPGELMSSDLMDNMVLTMVNSENVTVSVTDLGISLSGPYFGNSTVVTPDEIASNGILHTVDGVFLPRFTAQDIIDTLESIDGLTTITSLIIAAGLEDAVRTTDLTLLAPTDAAFAALPDALVSYLSDPSNVADLQSVLLYHAIETVIPSEMFTNGQLVTSSQGSNITVSIGEEGTIFFNDAETLVPDILAQNGLIDVIDTVLIPPGFELPGMPTSMPGLVTPTASPGTSMPTPSPVGTGAPTPASPGTNAPTPELVPETQPTCAPIKGSKSKDPKFFRRQPKGGKSSKGGYTPTPYPTGPTGCYEGSSKNGPKDKSGKDGKGGKGGTKKSKGGKEGKGGKGGVKG